MTQGMGRIPEGDFVLYDDRDDMCRYQIARIREWDVAGRLVFVPLSDPRVLLWFGDPDTVLRPGAIAFLGADGSESSGPEALEQILHRLPSGRGEMLAVLRNEPAFHAEQGFDGAARPPRGVRSVRRSGANRHKRAGN